MPGRSKLVADQRRGRGVGQQGIGHQMRRPTRDGRQDWAGWPLVRGRRHASAMRTAVSSSGGEREKHRQTCQRKLGTLQNTHKISAAGKQIKSGK